MKIIIGRTAERQLEAIAKQSREQYGAAQAEQTIAAIEAVWLAIAHFPQIARPVPNHPGMLRLEAAVPFVVFVKRTTHGLSVVQVLHASMIPSNWL